MLVNKKTYLERGGGIKKKLRRRDIKMFGHETGKDYWTWIKISVVIAILAGVASVVGPFVDNIGATDTANPSGSESSSLLAGDDDKTFIKTVEVPLGETGLEAVRKASPGIFYEYTDYDDSQIIGHKGFVILEKSNIEGTRFLFDGSEVEIIKIGGHYKIKSLDNINPSWCVVYRLPIISSSGKPILENAKYIEFHFSTDNLKDGKYAYLVLSKKE